MAFTDPFNLVDKSTGTAVTVPFTRIASAGLPNDVSFRQVMPLDPSDIRTLMLQWKLNKAGLVTASFATRREVILSGFSDLITIKTVMNIPRQPKVITQAQIKSLLSTHGSFIDTSVALSDTSAVMRLVAGEI